MIIMWNKNPLTIWLVVIVSVIATIIGMKNLIWFVETINSEVVNIERKAN